MSKNCKNCEYPWSLHHAETLKCPCYEDAQTFRETIFQDYPAALSEGMTGWRLLNHGEVIEKTDEFYRPGMGVWILISGPGFSEGTIWRDTHLPVRRRLSSPAPTQKAGEV